MRVSGDGQTATAWDGGDRIPSSICSGVSVYGVSEWSEESIDRVYTYLRDRRRRDGRGGRGWLRRCSSGAAVVVESANLISAPVAIKPADFSPFCPLRLLSSTTSLPCPTVSPPVFVSYSIPSGCLITTAVEPSRISPDPFADQIRLPRLPTPSPPPDQTQLRYPRTRPSHPDPACARNLFIRFSAPATAVRAAARRANRIRTTTCIAFLPPKNFLSLNSFHPLP